jgi:hypothetical protein
MKGSSLPIPRAILDLAHRHAESGEVHQAAELYFRLLEQFPATQEAAEAGRRVLGIAQRFEAAGKRRLALSLYRKLGAFSVPRTGGSALGSLPQPGEGGEASLRRKASPVDPMGEIPFVDLTRPTKMKRNFDRLGSVQRTNAEISTAATQLRKLEPDPSIEHQTEGQHGDDR